MSSTDDDINFSSPWSKSNDKMKENASSLNFEECMHIFRNVHNHDLEYYSHDNITELLNIIIKQIEDISLNDIIQIYYSLSHIQYQNYETLELFAESILMNKNLSKGSNKQLSDFILHIGKLYSKNGLPKSTQFPTLMMDNDTIHNNILNEHDSYAMIMENENNSNDTNETCDDEEDISDSEIDEEATDENIEATKNKIDVIKIGQKGFDPRYYDDDDNFQDLELTTPTRFKNKIKFSDTSFETRRILRQRARFAEKKGSTTINNDEHNFEKAPKNDYSMYKKAIFVSKETGRRVTRVIFEEYGDNDGILDDSLIDEEEISKDAHNDTKTNKTKYKKVETFDRQFEETPINAQIQLVRVLGSQVLVKERITSMSPKELFNTLHGFCLMKYKRSSIIAKLLSRMRLLEFHSVLTNREISNLIYGVGTIKYRVSRIMSRLCQEVMKLERLQKYKASEISNMMLGLSLLEFYDQQTFVTLALNLIKCDDMTFHDSAKALYAMSCGRMRDLPSIHAIIKPLYMNNYEGVKNLLNKPSDFLKYLCAVVELRLIDESANNAIVVALTHAKQFDNFNINEICELWKILGDYERMPYGIGNTLLNKVMDNIENLNRTDIINLMHGIGRCDHGLNQSDLIDVYQAVTKPSLMIKYGLTEISDLGLSLALAECSDRESVNNFWNECAKDVRVRRFNAMQMTHVMEAASRLNLENTEQLAVLTFRATQFEKLHTMNMPQFVSILNSISKLFYKDNLIIKTLIKEFVKPSRIEQMPPYAIPSVLKCLIDLNHPERNRLDFLAMEIRHHPYKIVEWDSHELSYVWRAFRQLECEDMDTMKILKKEMRYRNLDIT